MKAVCDICQGIKEVRQMAIGQYCKLCQPLMCSVGNHPPAYICLDCASKDACPAEVKK